MNSIVKKKLKRLSDGEPLRVFDLFSGCGGISLGFFSAGFSISAAADIDPEAARTHALNFHGREPERLRDIHTKSKDLTKIEPEELLQELELGKPEMAIDVIVGGPPCQSFARVGRAKLREVAQHPEAFRLDPRGNLYLRYLHYVERLRPLALLMENVPDVLNYAGHNIYEEVCEVLEEMGYICAYTMMNASHYGVPEMRERAFLIAYAKEISGQVKFPNPTHRFDLPNGFKGSRSVALKATNGDLFSRESHFVQTPETTPGLPSAVTAREAIGDLPSITIHLEGRLKRGARKFTELMPYPVNGTLSEYARKMRGWKSFSNKKGVLDHVIRYLPRDYAIFRRMNPGDQYPEAYEHSMKLLDEKISCFRKRGIKVPAGSVEYEKIKKETVPPYDVGKFPNKWRKMESDQPARTIMAHIGKDSYTHIHYDSEQARTISVREAARLQSFPDGFVFCGAMNAAFRQIGNAAPPLHVKAIAHEIKKTLRNAARAADDS